MSGPRPHIPQRAPVGLVNLSKLVQALGQHANAFVLSSLAGGALAAGHVPDATITAAVVASVAGAQLQHAQTQAARSVVAWAAKRHPYMVVMAADPAFGPLQTLGLVPVASNGSFEPERVISLPILGTSEADADAFLTLATKIDVTKGCTDGSTSTDAIARQLWAHPPEHTEAANLHMAEWYDATIWGDRLTVLSGSAGTCWAVPVDPPRAVACSGRDDRWAVAQAFQTPQGRTWAVWTGEDWLTVNLENEPRSFHVTTFTKARHLAVSMAEEQGWPDNAGRHPIRQAPFPSTPPALADRLGPGGVLAPPRSIPAWSKPLGVDPRASAPWGGVARAASLGQPGWIAWRTNPDQTFSVLGRQDSDGFGVLIVEHPDPLTRAAVRLGVPLRHEPDVPEPLIAALRPRLPEPDRLVRPPAVSL